jgi:hypothetical protein
MLWSSFWKLRYFLFYPDFGRELTIIKSKLPYTVGQET